MANEPRAAGLLEAIIHSSSLHCHFLYQHRITIWKALWSLADYVAGTGPRARGDRRRRVLVLPILQVTESTG